MTVLFLGGVAWIVSGLAFGKALEEDSDRRRAMYLLIGLVVLGIFAVAVLAGSGSGHTGANLVNR